MDTTNKDTASWRRGPLEKAYAATLKQLLDHVENSRTGSTSVVRLRPIGELRALLKLEEFMRDGGMDEQALQGFLSTYLEHTTRLHHPGYLAHQVASVHAYSGLPDLIHGLTNNPMAIFEMGPAGATVEVAVVDWMLDKVGFRRGVGVLTHGGSLANCTALLAARAHIAPDAWERGTPNDLVVLVPHVSHYSVSRAVSILGLGANSVRHLAVDEFERVQPESVSIEIERARSDGKRVMAVVANACATSTGLHDPIRLIGEICKDARVWFHVDAAHGASALLSGKERHWLDGIDLAESTVWDAHKMLRTSTLCAAVLFRNPNRFDEAFHQQADYLFYGNEGSGGASGGHDEVDLISRTIECTKAQLGLKVFLSLALHGEAGLGDYVESRYQATRAFCEQIRGREHFECPYRPEANIVCFRYVGPRESSPNDAELDQLQIRIRDHLLRSGSFYLSSTTLRRTRYLRLTVMSPETNEQTISSLLDTIERLAPDLR